MSEKLPICKHGALARSCPICDEVREALEEAAKVCDELRNKDYSSEDERWVAGTDDCAVAIRAMKECE
jgi:hypothetical protein